MRFSRLDPRLAVWLASLAAGFSLAYCVACRWLGFFTLGRLQKALLLAGCTLALALVCWRIVSRLRGSSKRGLLLALLGGGLLAVVLFAGLRYKPPYFPAPHTLVVTATGERNPSAQAAEVELLAVHRLNQPGGVFENINPAGLELGEGWRAENGIYLAGGETVSELRYAEFMQAGLRLTFRSTPRSGIVRIQWDGAEQAEDLYDPAQSTREVHLSAAFPWRSLSLPWKLLVGAAVLADFISLGLLLAGLLALLRWAARRWRLLLRAAPRLLWVMVPLIALLLAGAAGNLWRFSHLETASSFRLMRLASNSLADLDDSNRDHVDHFMFYLYLAQHQPGRTLRADAGLLKELGLSADLLSSWGRLGMVERSGAPAQLSAAQAARLEAAQHDELPKGGSLKYRFVILTGEADEQTPLCLSRNQKTVYLYPCAREP